MLDLLQDASIRLWHDLMARPDGPMSFRFILQPTMAAIAAIRAGMTDARTGRSPYFLALWTEPAERRTRLREAVKATTKIFLIGLLMDGIYQFAVLKMFYPLEALIVALVLAVVPYFLLRGPAARIARWWQSRHGAHRRAAPR